MNPQGLPFWKTETIGNDFVLVHADDAVGLDFSLLAPRMCDRRYGVGGDGLLVVSPHAGAGFDVDLRMFNPDGTEDFCGNGLRCAANHARRQGWLQGEFTIRQHGRLCRVEATEDGAARSWLPPASFDPADIPANFAEPGEAMVAGVRGIPVSTGTAHFVAFVDQLPADPEFFRASPLIENDAAFPERTSIMWTQPEGDRFLRLRIWERGAGETLGCGTGSSAAAAAWSERTGLTGAFQVMNPGGLLEVVVLPDAILSTSRPRERAEGVFSPALLAAASSSR